MCPSNHQPSARKETKANNNPLNDKPKIHAHYT